MSHGSVQYHLNTIISNERPFLGCYSFLKKMKFGVILGQKGDLSTPHVFYNSIIPLRARHVMGRTIPLKYHISQRTAISRHSLKNEIWGHQNFIGPTRVL